MCRINKCLLIIGTVAVIAPAVIQTSPPPPLPRHRLPPQPLIGSSRIIGGDEVSIRDYPYQAALFFLDVNFRCGATIINGYWVLTAAHCLGIVAAEFFTIRVGSTFRNREGVIYQAEEIVIHHSYNDRNFDFDVALMRMKTEMDINSGLNIKAIPLLGPDEDLTDGQLLRVSGWGFTDERFDDPTILRAVTVPKVNHQVCEMQLASNTITENMFCAGYEEGGRDSCFGDDGGPAVTMDGKLAGVISWGQGCADPMKPSVYVRLSRCLDWIHDTVGAMAN